MSPAPKAFVIGHPIAHSRSPLIHGFWLKQHGLDGSYERIDVAPTAIRTFLGGFAQQGYRGGNVTVPHKEAVFALVDEATDRARRLGAVNTLWLENGRLHGDNTDILGFTAHLEHSIGAARMVGVKTALILGAGGGARGIVAGLLDRGVARILVANRSRERAEAVTELDPARVAAIAWSDLAAALERADLVVNTTSLGMHGQPSLDLDLSPLPDHAVVADIVYVPLETSLLAAARARGLTGVDGLGMLLHQAVPGFARWFGVTPAVTPELRRLIVADLAAHGC